MVEDYSKLQVQTYVNEQGKGIHYVVLPADALKENPTEVINTLREKLNTDLVALLFPEITPEIFVMAFPEFGQIKATEVEGIIIQHRSHELGML